MLGINETIINEQRADVLYLDFKFDKSGQSDSMCSFVKSLYLGEINNDFNEEKFVAEYLQQNIPNNDINNFNIDFNKIQSTDTNLERIIISKLMSNALLIATEGRMGLPNTLILNANTYLNGSFGASLNNAVKKFAKENVIKIYHSIHVEENVIYLMRNSEKVNPGFYIFKHTDKENKNYHAITGLGFFPEKQCAKIKIIEEDNITSDSLFSDDEKEINIDSIKQISEMNNRTLPLSECGLFLIYTIGTQGLSPQRAENDIALLMEKCKDYNNEIGKHFKFYKEFWLPDSASQGVNLEIKLI